MGPHRARAARAQRSAESADRGVLEIGVGRRRPVPLLFVSLGPRTYVVPSQARARWFLAALASGACQVRWPGGRPIECRASLVGEPAEAERALQGLRAKYGEAAWRRYFATASHVIALEPLAPGAPATEVDLVRAEFDATAPRYDRALSSEPFERYLKDRALAEIIAWVDGFDPLLEIGPGTGFHTLPLLRAGHRVTGVDISPRMLEVVHDHALRAGMADRLTLREGRLGDLDAAIPGRPVAAFSAAVSAFGAFNLEPVGDPVVRALARLVRPSGRLIFTSLNRPGWVPMAWEMLLRRPKSAGLRLRTRVPPGGLRYPLALYLRSPTEWDRLLAPSFRRIGLAPVSVLTPPFESPAAARFLGPQGRARARRLDDRLSHGRGLWPAAEWLVLAYERRRDGRSPRSV